MNPLEALLRRHLAAQEAMFADHRREHGRREQRARGRRIRSRVDLLRGILEEWETEGAPGSVREPTP